MESRRSTQVGLEFWMSQSTQALVLALTASAVACTPNTASGPNTGGAASAPAQDQTRGPEPDEPEVPEYVLLGDLDAITKQGTLRFIVSPPPDGIARDTAKLAAAERKLARRLARKLGVKPVFIEAEDLQTMWSLLDAGKGDIIATALTVTAARSERATFSRPLRFVKQELVAKRGVPALQDESGLDGLTVTVRPSSAYHATLTALQKKHPKLHVAAAAETDDTYSLLASVARGELKYTVADSDILDEAQAMQLEVEPIFALVERDPIAWAMRKEGSGALKNAVDAFLVEHALTSFKDDKYKADLAEVQSKEVLRVLTRNSSTSYFIYRGEQLGFEYEMMKDVAQKLGVRLEIVIPPSREALERYLADGRGDVVAAGLTITPERSARFAFSQAYNEVSELIVLPVGHKAQHLEELKGVKIAARKSSSYWQTLEANKARYGFEPVAVPEDMETEDIIAEVVAGKYQATIADSNIVEVELTYNDAIRSLGPLGEPRQVGWMLRNDQPALKAALDDYVKKNYRGLFYNMMVNKYFKNSKLMKVSASDERSDAAGGLSPYDALVKRYAKKYEFDWRLITSQMYQESRFDPNAKSWVGAQGLMQVMPRTAKELKIDNVVEPENGIQAGVKLMSRYASRFNDSAVKEKDRIRFALAAYNAGPGHVIDARRIARDLKLNPNKWFGNVEKAMLLLSKPEHAKRAKHGYCRCEEPVKYVSEIQSRYDGYAKLVGLD